MNQMPSWFIFDFFSGTIERLDKKVPLVNMSHELSLSDCSLNSECSISKCKCSPHLGNSLVSIKNRHSQTSIANFGKFKNYIKLHKIILCHFT